MKTNIKKQNKTKTEKGKGKHNHMNVEDWYLFHFNKIF